MTKIGEANEGSGKTMPLGLMAMDNQTDRHFIVCLAFCIERSCQVRARAAQLLWVSQQNTRSSVPVSRYIVEALLMLECSSERMKHDEFKWKTMSMYIVYRLCEPVLHIHN